MIFLQNLYSIFFMNVSVSSISFSSPHKKSEGGVSSECEVDSKVKGLALAKISTTRQGGLLPLAAAPQVVIDLLPVFGLAKKGGASRSKRRPRYRKVPLAKSMPIGLRLADPEGWVNALMQFILFVPDFAELFFFAPHSWPFQEFIDQYHLDQQEGRFVSAADGNALLHFFKGRLLEVSLHEVFQFLACTLCPRWQLQESLETGMALGLLPDLFVMQGSKRQAFISTGQCYDLDAFIELRPDGNFVGFVAYVKVGGVWYQCDGDRITQMRSNCLAIPLIRAVLLHYRLIDLYQK